MGTSLCFPDEQPVAEHGIVPPDRLFNRTLTAQRVRQLCAAEARPTSTLLSKYTQLATASKFLFLVPVKRHGCQYCNRTESSRSNAPDSGKQTQHDIRVKPVPVESDQVTGEDRRVIE